MDELEKLFEHWWTISGSGIMPKASHDTEEHAKRISKIAYFSGVVKGIKTSKTGLSVFYKEMFPVFNQKIKELENE